MRGVAITDFGGFGGFRGVFRWFCAHFRLYSRSRFIEGRSL